MRVYQGKRDKFEYEMKTRQDEKRSACTQKIPPGELAHDGPCRCAVPAEEHFCGHKCPGCLYMCARSFSNPCGSYIFSLLCAQHPHHEHRHFWSGNLVCP